MRYKEFFGSLNYKEGFRIGLSMLPMLIAYAIGRSDLGVPLGQAGFFVSVQPLPKRIFFRITNGILFLTIGLGFYLIGGNVVFNYWYALVYTFLVSLTLGLITGWRMISILAFGFFSIYSAGLNASSPERVQTSFLAFAVAIAWASTISLTSFFPGVELPKFQKPPLIGRVEMGLRMAISTTLAFGVAEGFNFSRLGWAPSAAASIQRFEMIVSDQRAKARALGTIIGAVVVMIFFTLVPNTSYWVVAAFIVAILNGLTVNINKLGFLPFYTIVILILYSANDPTASTATTVERVVYNLVGILIALVVVHYSFPRLFNYIRTRPVFREEIEQLGDKI